MLPERLHLGSSTGVIEGMPIDLYSKSAVIIQAENNVSSLQATLENTILPSSLSILVLLPCFFVLILVCILVQLDCKRNQLPVRTIDDVRMGLEKPVGEWITWSAGEWIAWSAGEWIAWSAGEWIAWSTTTISILSLIPLVTLCSIFSLFPIHIQD